MKRDLFEKLMRENGDLVNSKSIEFFAAENWEKLDESWKKFLKKCSVKGITVI